MTSRELVKATLDFQNKTERAPREIWTLPWAYMFDRENIERIINKYEWDIAKPQVIYKQSSSVSCGDPNAKGEFIDAWGCKFLNIYDGVMGEVKEPLVTDDDWSDTSKIVFPEEWLSFDIEQVNRECAKSDKYMLASVNPRFFERLQFIRGTENLYVDLLLQPEGMLEFMKKLHDFNCRLLTKWAQTDVDALEFMDDWGSQESLLINPALWRELFKPFYKDYIDIAHAHGKKIFMHSDGYILDIIPDLIEIGLDVINCQIFCMGPEKLSQFKGKLAFRGEICRQQIIPFGTPDEVKAAVTSVYENLWENGGCIAQCEYGTGAKGENIDLIYKQWDELTSKG